jgi:hypothetical protein
MVCFKAGEKYAWKDRAHSNNKHGKENGEK